MTKVTLPRIIVAFFHGTAILPLWKIIGSISKSGEYLNGFIDYISLQLSVDYLTAKLYSIPFGLLYIIGGYLVLKSKEIRFQWFGACLYLLFFSSFWILAYTSKTNDCVCPNTNQKWFTGDGTPLIYIYKDSEGLYECYNRNGNHPYLPNTKLRKPTIEESLQIREAIHEDNLSIFRCCKKNKKSQLDKIFDNG
jgi:hypothetical protein